MMKSLRKKFYITYVLITAAGAFTLRDSMVGLLDLPEIFGVDIYSFVLGLLYLVLSVVLLEFFVLSRINHIKKDLQHIKDNGFSTKKKVLDLSRSDELGEIVQHINETINEVNVKADKLKHKNALYLSLVQDPSIYVYRFKEDGQITFVNQTYAELFNKSYKKMINKNAFDFISEPEELRKKISCLNPASPSLSVSIDMPKIIGQVRPKWIAWSVSAAFDERGKAAEYQVVGINMHYTESNRFKSVDYENIFLMSKECRIFYVDGKDDFKDRIGENFLDHIHQKDRDAFIDACSRTFGTEEKEVRNIRYDLDGEYSMYQALIEASKDKHSEVSSISVKMIDITGIEGAQAEVVGAVNNMNRLLNQAKA